MRRDLVSGVRTYLARNPWAQAWDDALPAPKPELKLCIVIPSLAESRLLPRVLESLQAGRRLAEAEVIVLVNNAEHASPEILADNAATLQLQTQYRDTLLPIYFVDRALPPRGMPEAHAGVGLARRLGLDLALARLAQVGDLEVAALACLDADSPVAPGYIDTLLDTFGVTPPPVAGYCAYAHPLPSDPALRPAGVAYELWLRYLTAGLRAAGSWFAFPTVGSCMVVSAAAYAQVGGLEPRQAAEDFHFLRKLAKLSGERPLAAIDSALVFPEARVSGRVPFGTGRAMQRSLEEGADFYLWVDPASAFLDLAVFFQALPAAFDDLTGLHNLPPRLSAFLEEEKAWVILEKFQKTYPSSRQFVTAGQHWFDSLRIIRYAHVAGRLEGNQWIFSAWRMLLESLGLWGNFKTLEMPGPGNQDTELHFQ
ncbi:MAG: glycosyltransferase family 2 protein, partial [Candidatus Firestonebacteria bacterium]|nr:glycosyltransferase family 2 protein [Candidatus Firestonebacteria bacterium]